MSKYVLALLGLLMLTAPSFGMHYAPVVGDIGAVLALVIATAKISIVALLCLGIAGDVAFR